MLSLSLHDYGMMAALVIIMFAVIWTLRARSRTPSSRIQLDDLLLGDDGRISKSAAVMFGSFIVTSWIVVFQAINKTLSDITFAAYIAAWVAPSVTRLLKGPETPPQISETITASTRTVVVDKDKGKEDGS